MSTGRGPALLPAGRAARAQARPARPVSPGDVPMFTPEEERRARIPSYAMPWTPSPRLQRVLREERERKAAQEAERQRRYDARFGNLIVAKCAAVFLGRRDLEAALEAEWWRRAREDIERARTGCPAYPEPEPEQQPRVSARRRLFERDPDAAEEVRHAEFERALERAT